MKAKKDVFVEVANAQISDKRTAVISKLGDSYTIGQKIDVVEGDKSTQIFLKGAIHVQDKLALQNLRDAINIVLKK